MQAIHILHLWFCCLMCQMGLNHTCNIAVVSSAFRSLNCVPLLSSLLCPAGEMLPRIIVLSKWH